MEIRELLRTEWPAPLLEIPQLPDQLWLRGTLPEPGTRLLTVVGSRAMTHYGQEACEKLITGLAGYPLSIVSGLALGVDTCAHKAALRAGLHTIAIPGSGLDDDFLYPRANLGLAHAILEAGGALMSEHEPRYAARAYDFPSRNRLMVGLADAVLVIEAGQRSGTLITARLAGEYNRELLCVPHRIGDPHAFGSHLFIRLGAALVSEPYHILEALKITPRESETVFTEPELEGIERKTWELLAEPKTRDEILRTGTREPSSGERAPSAGELLTALVSLELRGLIREEFGAWRRL